MNLLSSKSAFELLREFKEVSPETERLVLSVMSRKHTEISIKDLITIFEKGISGEYGKVYTLDPQTILGWVQKHQISINSSKDYLQTALLPIGWPGYENIDWFREANKCYQAFLKGVSCEYFHHCVYDRMMLDDKIKLNAYRKFYSGDDLQQVHAAQQKMVKEVFTKMKDQGLTYVYFIK